MHRLQAVSGVRKSTRNDDAHRVVKIAALQLVFDVDNRTAARRACC
jgi:hypothetical protein